MEISFVKRIWIYSLAAASLCAGALHAQDRADPPSMQRAMQLDLDGRTREAKVFFQQTIDSAPNAHARTKAQRHMALSYAFDGDCQNTIRYDSIVIAYWATFEQTDPQNSFYTQGE